MQRRSGRFLRRLLLPSLGGLVALVLTAPLAAAASRPPAWPQLGYDSGRTGFNPTETTLDAANVDELEVAWVRDSVYRGTPVFAKGLGYADRGIFDPSDGGDVASLAEGPVENGSAAIVRGKVISTSWDETLLSAMDARTGEVLWSNAFGSRWSSPTVAGGKIYVRSGSVVRAIRPGNGSVLWRARLKAEVVSDVTVSDGYAFVLTRRSSSAAPDGITKIVALDAATGNREWSRKVAYSMSGYRDVFVASDGIVLASLNYKLAALDVSDGSTLWKSHVTCCSHSPSLAGDTVFTTTWADGGTLFALDASTGEVLWSSPGAGSSKAVTVANGVVYTAHGGLQAYDAGTGRLLLDLDIGITWSAPVVVDGAVYLSIENGPGTPPATGEGLYAFRLP